MRLQRSLIAAAAATVSLAIWGAGSRAGHHTVQVFKEPQGGSTSPTTPGPCPTGSLLPAGQRVIIDHSDFVRLGGVMFAAGLGEPAPLTPGEPLGAVVGTVRCILSNEPSNHADPPLVDGTASFLPAGTEIH